MIYGYCSADYPGQVIQRQEKKLKEYNENIIIYTEDKERNVLDSLLKEVKDGDTLVLNDILKLSDLDESFDICLKAVIDRYQYIFNIGADIVFLEQPGLNSRIYRDAIVQNMTKDSSPIILTAYQILMEHIKLELRKMMNEASFRRDSIKCNIKSENRGIKKGTRLTTRKEQISKKYIIENHKEFGGNMSNQEVIHELGISNNTFYKYMRDLRLQYGKLNKAVATNIDKNIEKTKENEKTVSIPISVINDIYTVSPANEKKEESKDSNAEQKNEQNEIAGQMSITDFL